MSAPLSPSGDAWRRSADFPRVLALVLLAIFAARVFVGAILHLSEDEAYYRLWAMAPALGYYDHPPMIAWWIWIGRGLAGDTSLGVRLLPILASAITTGLVFDMARLVGADRGEAIRAAVWYNAMLLVVAGAVLAVPDAPAALFWTLTLWCCLRAIASARATRWWIAAGVAAGLACLSKYSALFLAPGILVWLVWRPQTRSWLGRPGPWIAALIAALIFSLNVGWNATHHWLTFIKQFGRIAPSHLAPVHLAAFVVAQGLLLNPLIALFLIRSLVDRTSRERLAPFMAISAPFVAYLLLHSLHDSVQAHWPAPLYPSLAVCAAAGAGEASRKGRWNRLRLAAPVLGLAFYPLLLALALLPATVTGRLTGPVQGWPAFARRLEAMRSQTHAGWIGTFSYGLTAELADETAIRAPILQITERDRYLDLPLSRPNMNSPGLILDLARRVDRAALERCFTYVRALGVLERVTPSAPGRAYAVYFVSDARADIVGAGCRPGP
jgi:4-amino-4-deoxy-L-arabinose transferase-like glycosyltransferase